MSEYKTLDEWFPNGRGDGRRFTAEAWNDADWIEPVFISKPCRVYETTWHCLDKYGTSQPILRDMLQLKFKEWREPKKTKKVTLYKPVVQGYENTYYSASSVEWHSDKSNWDSAGKDAIVGGLSQEVDVECD